MSRDRRFLLVFALVALVIAGGISYLASSAPDGLDSATLAGCEISDTPGGELLTGTCIAQGARGHAMADSPLAGYTVGGRGNLTGIAGVIGVLVTCALAGGLFCLLARRRPAGGDAQKQPTGRTRKVGGTS